MAHPKLWGTTDARNGLPTTTRESPDFSHGECQEPTAAIDPYEETRIYNQFAQISMNKSAIIVTHRLGAVKLADRIIVMKDGHIEEIGTHDELINKGNEYARLYSSQKQWYIEQASNV